MHLIQSSHSLICSLHLLKGKFSLARGQKVNKSEKVCTHRLFNPTITVIDVSKVKVWYCIIKF